MSHESFAFQHHDPRHLLARVMGNLGVKNDAALCRRLFVRQSDMSKIRNRKMAFPAHILITMHKATNISIPELEHWLVRGTCPER